MQQHTEFMNSSTLRKVLLVTAALAPITGWAQSSITLFGTLDTGLLYTDKTLNMATGKNGGSQFSFVSSGMEPSTFGLTGTEDLGDGLKARFELESGIDLANGGYDNTNGNLFGRQAWVALSSNTYGTVTTGLQFSPFLLALYQSDARSMSQFASAMTMYADNTFTGSFVSNGITYKSPDLAGFTGEFMYVLGGVAGDFQAGRAYSASLSYTNDGLMLNAAIFDSSAGNDAALYRTLFSAPLEGRTIGAGYTFSSFSIKGSFSNFKAPTGIVGGLISGGDNDLWNLGVSYSINPFLALTSEVWYTRDPHQSQTHGLLGTVGTTYQLSKRTLFYINIGIANNRGNSDLGLTIDGALDGPPGTTVGGNFGIVHNF